LETKSYTTLPHREMTQTTVASLVNRIETNVNGLTSKLWQDDELFMIVWEEMLENVSGYKSVIGTVRKDRNGNAKKVAKAIRKRAIVALHYATNLYRVSEVDAEVEAYHLIYEQLKSLKIKNQNNKENQSTNFELMVEKLRSVEYLPSVQLLKLEPQILRLENANVGLMAFEQAKSSKKMQKKEETPVPTRKDLLGTYHLMANYVQIKQATGKEPFGQIFEAIDEARSYFSTDLAYRKTLKKSKEKEQDSTNPVVAIAKV